MYIYIKLTTTITTVSYPNSANEVQFAKINHPPSSSLFFRVSATFVKIIGRRISVNSSTRFSITMQTALVCLPL